MSAKIASGDFLLGGGEMAERIRSKDWGSTPLGPISTWPQSLLTTVSLCLASNFPINIIWGPDAVQIYNDGYRVVCGEAHPRALGEPYTVTWESAWPAIGEPFEHARIGETSFLENQRMFLTRNGYLEETFFTFSLSPVRGESGGIDGLFHPVTETTANMVAERRTRALRDLTAQLAAAASIDEVVAKTVATLKQFSFDVPFLLIYGVDESNGRYVLRNSFGVDGDCVAAPAVLPFEDLSPWPTEALSAGPVVQVDDIAPTFSGARCGPYEEPPNRAFAISMTIPGVERAPFFAVAGVSPRLPLTEDYRGFVELLGSAIGAALANVRAREDERRRAEALAEIDRAKTAFFSNVSHEFRTPLTLMLGPLEDVLDNGDGLAPNLRRHLVTAHRNSLRLLKLVNALLDFSRLEAGRMQASFQPTDLSALTADLASNFRSACERAGLELVVDCPPMAQTFYIDRDMWEKIILNLVSNAFKFTLVGQITVALKAIADGAELTVTDTGVGIPSSQLDRVFERFHRIEGQEGRTHEGTGIGLSLVRELVDLHGGAITVKSQVSQGASFHIWIKSGTAHLTADQVKTPAEKGPGGVRPVTFVEEALRWLPDEGGALEPPIDSVQRAGGPRRVVLADDNGDMRDYVRRILEQNGYAVEAVANGAQALRSVRSGPLPDLILSDVMMPQVDGFQLVAALRADPKTSAIPVVLLSARAGEEARIEGLASGADDYLVKPFSARELCARLDGVIRLAVQRRESDKRERDLQEQIAEARLRQTEFQLEFALKAGRLGSWDIDMLSNELTASDICLEIFGLTPGLPYSREQMIGRIHPDDLEHRQIALERAVTDGSPLDLEYRVLDDAGRSRWVLMRGLAAYSPNGTPIRLAGVSIDITERKRAEDRQKLLLDELNHRVKNTLATVQSISMQTRKNAPTLEAFGLALDARLDALARAHDLLTHSNWDEVSLSDVVALTLRPYDLEGSRARVTTTGPNIMLGPTAAVTMNMAFHELATNAAKYGSLRTDAGHIDVTWSVDRSRTPHLISLAWQESGGPPVKAPQQRGFGSRLLEQGVGRELGARVALEFAPMGLSYTMSIPISGKVYAPI